MDMYALILDQNWNTKYSLGQTHTMPLYVISKKYHLKMDKYKDKKGAWT